MWWRTPPYGDIGHSLIVYDNPVSVKPGDIEKGERMKKQMIEYEACYSGSGDCSGSKTSSMVIRGKRRFHAANDAEARKIAERKVAEFREEQGEWKSFFSVYRLVSLPRPIRRGEAKQNYAEPGRHYVELRERGASK